MNRVKDLMYVYSVKIYVNLVLSCTICETRQDKFLLQILQLYFVLSLLSKIFNFLIIKNIMNFNYPKPFKTCKFSIFSFFLPYDSQDKTILE